MSERKYSKNHIWIRENESNIVELGISEYAQKKLGVVMFVNLPEIDETIDIESAFGDIESVKTVTDLISPIDGKVIEVNDKVIDEPKMINECAEQTWLIRVEKLEEKAELLDEEQYKRFIGDL